MQSTSTTHRRQAQASSSEHTLFHGTTNSTLNQSISTYAHLQSNNVRLQSSSNSNSLQTRQVTVTAHRQQVQPNSSTQALIGHALNATYIQPINTQVNPQSNDASLQSNSNSFQNRQPTVPDIPPDLEEEYNLWIASRNAEDKN